MCLCACFINIMFYILCIVKAFLYQMFFLFQVFSIIVFGCILSGGYYEEQCQMNDSGACGYGVGIGVLAFLFCIAFLIVDVLFDNMSSVQHRKYAVLADLGISGKHVYV